MVKLTKRSIALFDKYVLTNYSENGNRLLDIDSFLTRLTTSPAKEFIGKYAGNGNSVAYLLGTLFSKLTFTGVEPFAEDTSDYVPYAQSKEADVVIKTTLKKRFNQLKSKLEKPAPADSKLPFGKVLFGPQRSKPEPNTGAEQYLFKQIFGYTEGDINTVSPQTKNELAQLLANKQYTDILKRPKAGQSIYRGMNLQKDQIVKIVPIEELDTNASKRYSNKTTKALTTPLIFKPKETISSWSKSEQIAHDFSIRNHENYAESYSVVLISKVKPDQQSNYFDLDAWYKEIGGLDNEEEVIALSDVEVFEIKYWKN